MNHAGSCHCGRIRYTVEGTPDSGMECNCSICARKGYVLWFVPRAQLVSVDAVAPLHLWEPSRSSSRQTRWLRIRPPRLARHDHRVRALELTARCRKSSPPPR